MSLVEFLQARITEEAELARHAVRVPIPHFDRWMQCEEDKFQVVAAVSFEPPIARAHSYWSVAEHIAHWDPARVIAECKARWQVVDQLRALTVRARRSGRSNPKPEQDTLEWVCRQMTLPYVDHPDFRQEWRP